MNATVTRAVEPPLVTRIIEHFGGLRVDESGFDAFTAGPGITTLFFTEDPVRVRETLDLAVILPELVGALATPMRIGVLPPALADAKAARYGVRRWPALVFLRDGGWLGNIEGLRDWADYVALARELIAGPVRALPAKVIPVAVAGAHSCS